MKIREFTSSLFYFDSACHTTAVVVSDRAGTIEYVNPAFVNVCGYFPEEIRGNRLHKLKSCRQPLRVYVDLWNTIASCRPWTGRLEWRRKDGSFYWTDTTVFCSFSDEMEILNYVVVQHSVTDLVVKVEVPILAEIEIIEPVVSTPSEDLSLVGDSAKKPSVPAAIFHPETLK